MKTPARGGGVFLVFAKFHHRFYVGKRSANSGEVFVVQMTQAEALGLMNGVEVVSHFIHRQMRLAVIYLNVRELVVQKLFRCADALLQYELFHCLA